MIPKCFMKKTFITCLILLSSLPAFSDDHSGLSVSAGSYSGVPKVQFIVFNSNNQRSGYLPGVSSNVDEIPDASYGVTRLGTEDTGADDNDWATVEFSNNGPISIGTYTITFYGLADTKMWYSILVNSRVGDSLLSEEHVLYVSSNTAVKHTVFINPEAGLGSAVVVDNTTFETLRVEVSVAQKLEQVGDDKFSASLQGYITHSEKLAGVCFKHRTWNPKDCHSATDVLRLFIKRLELANRKCDTTGGCDEGPELAAFEKAHRGERDYDDFFRAWDKDDWHKWKKTSKRFVTDEALAIIRGDAEILIKTLEPSPQKPEKH